MRERGVCVYCVCVCVCVRVVPSRMAGQARRPRFATGQCEEWQKEPSGRTERLGEGQRIEETCVVTGVCVCVCVCVRVEAWRYEGNRR